MVARRRIFFPPPSCLLPNSSLYLPKSFYGIFLPSPSPLTITQRGIAFPIIPHYLCTRPLLAVFSRPTYALVSGSCFSRRIILPLHRFPFHIGYVALYSPLEYGAYFPLNFSRKFFGLKPSSGRKTLRQTTPIPTPS